MSSSGHTVTISDHGGTNPVILPISNPSASWEVSAIGRFSCHIPAKRAHALGLGDLKGKRLRWDHPTMGAWGGRIKRNPTETMAGTMELSADSHHAAMKGVLTPISMDTATGSPGQLALRLLTVSATDRRMPFDSIIASSGGPVLRVDLRGDDLFDVISSLASENDHEFDVTLNDDGTVDWAFKRRVGNDLTANVILSEGWNVYGGTIAPTTDSIVNHILAVSDDQDWVTAPKKVVIAPDSITAYERQAETRRYTGMPGRASLNVRANADLTYDSLPAIPATITLRDNHPVLSLIRQGDTVRLWSDRQNAQYFFRIVSRSVEDGTAKIAGDCIEEDNT